MGRARKKVDKTKMAKRKLNRMKKLGFLSAPPRRSAALNASAIMNCMLETGPVKIKVERASEEDERINDRITSNSNTCTSSEKSEMSKSEIVDNSETQTEVVKRQ